MRSRLFDPRAALAVIIGSTAIAQTPIGSTPGTTSNAIEVQELAVAKPIDRQIEKGRVHAYTIALRRGQLLRFSIRAAGANIDVIRPDGGRDAERRAEEWAQGENFPRIGVVANTAGIRTIQVPSPSHSGWTRVAHPDFHSVDGLRDGLAVSTGKLLPEKLERIRLHGLFIDTLERTVFWP